MEQIIKNFLVKVIEKAIKENEVSYKSGTYCAKQLMDADKQPVWNGGSEREVSVTIDGVQYLSCKWCDSINELCKHGGEDVQVTFPEPAKKVDEKANKPTLKRKGGAKTKTALIDINGKNVQSLIVTFKKYPDLIVGMKATKGSKSVDVVCLADNKKAKCTLPLTSEAKEDINKLFKQGSELHKAIAKGKWDGAI